MPDCIIIGGGAAGLMAAVTAADCGKSVIIFEKNQRVGKKLLITGKGRCNVTNNCTVEELLARLRVLTRSKGSGRTNVFTLADLTVDTAARSALRAGTPLTLSAREYALLEYLIRNKGIILSREQIENNLWNYDYAGGTNVVDVYISYLRKKLDGGHEKKLLHTVRGMGWVLKEDV